MGPRNRTGRVGRSIASVVLCVGMALTLPGSASQEGAIGPLLSARAPQAGVRTPSGPTSTPLAEEILAARSAPPGLSQTRLDERRAGREERRAALSDSLSGRAGRLRANLLELWLLDPTIDPALWESAVELVGVLELEDFATALDWALDEGPTSPRRSAARRSLHQLYGLWFESSASLAPFVGAIDPEVRRIYRERLREVEQRELDQRRRAWEDPVRTAADLGDRSPLVRAAAGEHLVALLREQPVADSERAEALLLVLCDRLAVESDVLALHALLDAARILARGSNGDSPGLGRLRTLLIEGLRSRRAAILPSVTRCVSSLPVDPSQEASWLGIASALGQAVADRSRATDVDADVTIALLSSLRGLAVTVGTEPLTARFQANALTSALLELAEAARTPGPARRAALAALSDLASPDDLTLVVARLRGGRLDDALRFELLGVLQRLAGDLDDDPAAQATIAGVALEQLASEAVDNRRRAIALLELDGVGDALDAPARARLVDAILVESQADLRVDLLERLAPSGGAADLTALLEAPSFPADEGSARALAEIARKLAGGDRALVARCARRVAATTGAQTQRWALELVLGTVGDDGGSPEPEHFDWALSVLTDPGWREAGLAEGQAAWLWRGVESASMDAEPSARLRALLASAAGEDLPVLEREFEAALALSAEAGPRGRLLRERARARLQGGTAAAAFDDWCALRTLSGEAQTPAADLDEAIQAGARATADAAGVDDATALAVRTLDLGQTLLGLEAWRLGPIDARFATLELLVATADRAGGPDGTTALLDLLELDPDGPATDLRSREELDLRLEPLLVRLRALADASVGESTPADDPERDPPGGG